MIRRQTYRQPNGEADPQIAMDILRDPERWGGEGSLPVRWARMVRARVEAKDQRSFQWDGQETATR